MFSDTQYQMHRLQSSQTFLPLSSTHSSMKLSKVKLLKSRTVFILIQLVSLFEISPESKNHFGIYSSTKMRDSGTAYAGLYAADQKVFSRARDNIVLGLVCTCYCLQEHLATIKNICRI